MNNNTTTVKDWNVKVITTSKELNIPTVRGFLDTEVDYDDKGERTTDYIKALKSEQLSNFFMKRFKKDISIFILINLNPNIAKMSQKEREMILDLIDTKYEKAFVEYKELYKIYIEKLLLTEASKKLRNELLKEKAKQKAEYGIFKTEVVKQSEKKTTTVKPTARIKVKKVEPKEYSVYQLGHVSKSNKVEEKKAPVRATIK